MIAGAGTDNQHHHQHQGGHAAEHDAQHGVRRLRLSGEQWCTIAIASDLNPGTAWCGNMQFVIALACRYMKLTPAQAIAAATINAAAAIKRDDNIGSIEPGKQADLIILSVPDYRQLPYRFGTNQVNKVIKLGVVYESRNLC